MANRHAYTSGRISRSGSPRQQMPQPQESPRQVYSPSQNPQELFQQVYEQPAGRATPRNEQWMEESHDPSMDWQPTYQRRPMEEYQPPSRLREQSHTAEWVSARQPSVFDYIEGDTGPAYDDYEAYGEDYDEGGGRPAKMKKAKKGKDKKPPKAGAKKGRRALVAILLVLAIFGGLFAAGLAYLDGIFDTGVLGAITGADYVPKNYSKSDVINILIVGIDYEEGRYSDDGLGLTDMILYANYDVVNNKLNMLQIPRDSYVGEEGTGGTGKINALLMGGEDKSNPINNLAKVIEQQFQLPVDNYIALDMESMKAIVDTFGGIRVYVPREMSYEGSYLPAGWQWLNGDAAEFFVRNRSGEGFERADIDRLDNQRHFYSALFRRLLNLTPTDIVNLLPVIEHYCKTDLKLTDIFDLAFTALNLQAESVMFCKAPGATGEGIDPTGQNRSLYIIDKYGLGTEEDPGIANLMNQYFRTYGEPVAASGLGLPEVNISGYTLYPPNVQMMGEVQVEEGGADVNVEPTA